MAVLVRNIFQIEESEPHRFALNGQTYAELAELLRQERSKKRFQVTFIENESSDSILEILKAMVRSEPIVVAPKKTVRKVEEKDFFRLPLDQFSLTLFSSGTTGVAKPVTQSLKMIEANIKNAIECQRLNKEDRIYTVSSVAHAGGIHAQTLAALSVGAEVLVAPFSAYRFLKEAPLFSVTHLVPQQIRALSLTKGWKEFKKGQLRLVMCGSDCVEKFMVQIFVEKGINFIVNYGMSEAGPIICNKLFKDLSEVDFVYEKGIPLGDRFWCQQQIVEGELFLKGDPIFKEGWLATGDLVVREKDLVYFMGRKSC